LGDFVVEIVHFLNNFNTQFEKVFNFGGVPNFEDDLKIFCGIV